MDDWPIRTISGLLADRRFRSPLHSYTLCHRVRKQDMPISWRSTCPTRVAITMATTPQTIFKAITSADLPFVEDWCAEHGGDINVPDHLGRAPVHLAVMSSTPSIIQILIKRGARLNSKLSRGENVLHLAAMRGDMETLLTVMKGLEAENDRERMSDASDSRREVLHIDTLMSDPQVSALHLATIYGIFTSFLISTPK